MHTQRPWRKVYPELPFLSQTVTTILDRRAQTVRLEQDTVIFGPNKPRGHLLFLLSGTVCVQRRSVTGQKIVLRRVCAGESCVLTTACLLAFQYPDAEGLSETAVEALMIPKTAFDEMMMSSKEFRAFVFRAYSQRITDLFPAPQGTPFSPWPVERILH